MELRQLEYFVAVSEEANFTRAAERVHITQSGVSAQIRQLEHELGQPLLDRSGRSVRLTEVGAAVLPYAQAALDAVANARLVVDQLSGLVHGQVSVGMVNGCALPVLTELLATFHERHPGVAIALTEGPSDQLVDALRDGRLDIALIGTAGTPIMGVEVAPLTDEQLVAAVTAEHPLANRKTVNLDVLRDQPLITLPAGTGVRAALDIACTHAGFTPRIALEASALPMVAQLASRALGVAVLPASIAQAHPTLHVLKIVRPQLRSRLELAWTTTPPTNPAARALVEHSRTFLREIGVKGKPAA